MKKQALTIQDTKKIAGLAKLPLSDKETTVITRQLSETINSVDVLSTLQTDRTPGTFQVTGLTNIYRQDEVQPSFSQEEALSNAKHTHNGYFVVPYVFTNEEPA